MGMSIEKAINGVEKRILPIYDNYADHEALVTVIETMRKYQKIKELYDYWQSGKCEYTISCMENIGKVLRNGNVD